jgi:hypothetical protein
MQGERTVTELKVTLAIAAAALVSLFGQDALADCCRCGGDCGVRKVCRVVPDKRKIEKTVYGCECADMCLAGKSCRGCLNCEEKQGEGKDCDSCSHKPYALLRWWDWEPGCAQVKTVKKLTKYTVTKEVCGWKWQIEDVCSHCCPASNCVEGQDGMQVERPPAAAADQVPAPPVPIVSAGYSQPAAPR